MPLRESAYRLAVRAMRRLSPLLAGGESKLARGIRGRRVAVQELVRWADVERDPNRPLIWFHAPSVGEGFQARAVAEALLEERPGIQVAYTYFSPSAEAFAEAFPADVRAFLPWDLPGEVGPVLDALRPDLIAFTKTEIWPTLSDQADSRGIPSVLVAGTLPSDAGRLRGPARWLLAPAFRRLRAIGAVAGADAERFRLFGVGGDRITVTGDPGVDSALSRLDAADDSAPYLEPFWAYDGPVVVAGSTWPPDEEVLIPAATRAREALGGTGEGTRASVASGLLLVVAPHEPTEEHLDPLEGALRRSGWTSARLGEVESRGSLDGADAVVVDRVGVLAHLYTIGTVAYVGGGFGHDGLHSVLEPAAAAVPVLFGPRHANARAASDLLEAGGAREADSVESLTAALAAWLELPEGASSAGKAARAYLDRHRGASERTARMLMEVMEVDSGG